VRLDERLKPLAVPCLLVHGHTLGRSLSTDEMA